MSYEHKLAHTNDVDDLLADGWEPVPHVQPVVTYALAQPTTHVFLRRLKTLRGSRPRQ